MEGVGDAGNDLFGSSDQWTEFSRLSCQMALTEELDRLRLEIAAED